MGLDARILSEANILKSSQLSAVHTFFMELSQKVHLKPIFY